MRNLILRSATVSAMSAAVFAVSNVNAHAQVDLAYWNFNFSAPPQNGTAPGAETQTAFDSQIFAVSGGVNSTSASMSTNFAQATAYTTGGTTGVQTFTGTTVNAVSGDAAGTALALQGFSSPSYNNGNSLFFSVNSTGYQNLKVSLAIQATWTGFQADQFEYSTNGINYTALGSTFTPASSFANTGVLTFDLSSVTALNNLSTPAFFAIQFTGASSASGNNRIDNLQVLGSAVSSSGGATAPEPSALALLGAGLLPIGAVVRRRISRKA